mmetsp:Transcript_10392/g.29209  ORF Transcript_10392/g.29209 Transcript_10392/m.29209 type:complete len:266 (+) Transcript_10392:1122-1919(+)
MPTRFLERGADGLGQFDLLLLPRSGLPLNGRRPVRRRRRGTVRTTAASASAVTVAGPEPGSPRLGGDGSLDAQLVNLGHPEEALPVDEEVVLPPPGRRGHLRGGVGHDLEDVVAAHGPAELELGAAGHGVVDLLPVGQDQPLAGGDGPHDGHVVLLSAAGRSGFAGVERFSVGKAESPADTSLGRCQLLARCDGREIDLVDGEALGEGTAGGAGRTARGRGGGGRSRTRRRSVGVGPRPVGKVGHYVLCLVCRCNAMQGYSMISG